MTVDTFRGVLSVLDRLRGLADHVEHEAGLEKHRDVAALQLDGRSAHALSGEAFQVGMPTGSAGRDPSLRRPFLVRCSRWILGLPGAR